MSNIEQTFIITAGGIGKRMNSKIPKQFIELDNKPILWHTLNVFYTFNPQAQLLITLPEDWVSYWKDIIKDLPEIPHEIVSGGVERYDSIKNAIASANGKLIGIHDGVRPLVSHETIQNCIELATKKGNAVPVMSLKESIRKVSGENTETANRGEFRTVQTPQCFQAELLKSAYDRPFHDNITDDASLVEENGTPIFTCEGNEENIKITTQFDLKLAEMLIKS